MSPRHHTVAVIMFVMLFAGCGCFSSGGGGRGRTARIDKTSGSKQAKRPSAPPSDRRNVMASQTPASSPEASLQRDLDRLKDQEKQQAKLVKEMQDALAQNSGQARKEEEKLEQIRRQIDEFEVARKRFHQAVAMDTNSPRAPGEEYRGGGMTISTAGYDQQTPSRNRAADYQADDTPEEVLYNPSAPAQSAGYAQPGGQYGQNAIPNPAYRTNARRTMQDDEIAWNPPPTFFTQPGSQPAQDAGAIAKPQTPARRMPKNLPDPNMGRPAPGPAAPVPQVPAPAAVAAPVQNPVQAVEPAAQADSEDDGVFYPDRVLSGGF